MGGGTLQLDDLNYNKQTVKDDMESLLELSLGCE